MLDFQNIDRGFPSSIAPFYIPIIHCALPPSLAPSSLTVSHRKPRRGINFGPVAYNAKPPEKIFELKNEGEFEFVFAIQVTAYLVHTPRRGGGGWSVLCAE